MHLLDFSGMLLGIEALNWYSEQNGSYCWNISFRNSGTRRHVILATAAAPVFPRMIICLLTVQSGFNGHYN